MQASSVRQLKPTKQIKQTKRPQKNKQPVKGGKRLFRLSVLIMICALAWGAINFWDQAGKLQDRKQRVSALEQKKTEVTQLNDDTKREIARLNDNEYIEQKLRKDYGYVKPGETLFYRPKSGN
ncbi:FtsB family cell division protein [Paenibacillus thalictri]|uniref:Septum formation initiator family protein n=1 Tax=Paenibacillus thalictri TaxID=2527873 RepID=A0A4Q9DE30_9BACL|nr:septum formation initiator family protein [Paenibacillus thalictri]TBL69028.1 septum formation initiator family protein [Paenibacillus thalictri]